VLYVVQITLVVRQLPTLSKAGERD
jgi:hypothetical protein